MNSAGSVMPAVFLFGAEAPERNLRFRIHRMSAGLRGAKADLRLATALVFGATAALPGLRAMRAGMQFQTILQVLIAPRRHGPEPKSQ